MNPFSLALAALAVLAVGTGVTSLVTRTRQLAQVSLVASLLVPALGLAFTVVQLIQGFRALGAIDAASKSSFLSQRIAEAMNSTALGTAGVVPCLIVSVIALARASKRPVQNGPTAPRDSV